MIKKVLFLIVGIISCFSLKAQSVDELLQEGLQELKNENLQEAKRIFDTVLLNDKESVSAYFLRGYTLNLMGDNKAAIADFTQIIALDPNNTDAYDKRGICKKDFGDYQGALEDYNKAIALDPENSTAFYNRGVLHYFHLDNAEDACKDWTISEQLGYERAAGIKQGKCVENVGAIKTDSGFLLYFNREKVSYTLNLVGDVNISNMPYLSVNKKLIQFHVNKKEEFGTEALSVLKNYMIWEAEYISEILKEPVLPELNIREVNGMEVNFWSYKQREIAENEDQVLKTYFADFVKADLVFRFAYSSLNGDDKEANDILRNLLGNLKFHKHVLDAQELSQAVIRGEEF